LHVTQQKKKDKKTEQSGDEIMQIKRTKISLLKMWIKVCSSH